jgi:RimJ/RimL family protein N-acetyltransferase
MKYPLLTGRLSIQPLSMADLSSFVSYRQDPEIARFQGWEPSYSDAQGIELIQSQTAVLLPATGDWLQLAVHERASGILIGDIALHRSKDEESVFEIGFTIASQHQGQGFATEAVSRLMDSLFSEVGAKKLIAATDRRNTPSIKLLLKLGFIQMPDKGWIEEFKNETVTVDFFQTVPKP